MYLILPIALVIVLPSWFLLRRYTRAWAQRPLSVMESVLSGVAAWLFVFSSVAWLAGIILTTVNFLNERSLQDILALICSALITVYVIGFFIKSKYELGLDDTRDFIKEALQFRRSAQRRLDILASIQQRQDRPDSKIRNTDPNAVERVRLQTTLGKEKEYENHITRLREGNIVDISDIWRENIKLHAGHSLYGKVYEARIEPGRKRLSLHADFPELNEEQLKDETAVLKLNREVYDFLQSLHIEPWLKHYAQFFESYFLICRTMRIGEDGKEMFFPFMKVGATISDLLKLEGSYFNPRKLGEVTALAFNNGAQV